MCKAISVRPLIDYSDLAEYAKAYPDKLANWFAFRIADDDMAEIVREFYEEACVADYNGPAFEEWRKQ